MSASSLRIGRVEHEVTVLGPGTRSVVWVAGCRLACPGCVTPELWDPEAGGVVAVERLADVLVAGAVDGVTLSGGEPFEQAEALAALICHIRARRPGLSVMAYSGYTRRTLERRRDHGAAQLLAQLDLLVDGRYVRGRHAALRWRGSSNQTIHDLSGRHAVDLAAPDVPAGMHRHVLPGGQLRFTGVPPVPEFRDRLAEALERDPPSGGGAIGTPPERAS